MKNALSTYFNNFHNPSFVLTDKVTIEDIRFDTDNQIAEVYLNDAFGFQPFTPDLLNKLNNEVASLLPQPYNTYSVRVFSKGVAVEKLIPSYLQTERDSSRFYQRQGIRGNAWVSQTDIPYQISSGLKDCHLSVYASHGKYYRNSTREWTWQRPPLYCTREDLFTQTIVLPYLIPMLENAGAIVYSPRDRDWQKHEVVVDNDQPELHGVYVEKNDKYNWQNAGSGFAHIRDFYQDKENPFEDGTCRMADATNNRRQVSEAQWVPFIEEDGDYAVYVSYKTLPNSIPDAHYTVYHEGVATNFCVNQKMGSGTWVYLGTFHFAKGCTTDNCITLSNHSNYRGVVTADAVRLGGGMSNIARADSTMDYTTRSGLPRFLEASRYTAMWSGIPYWVYSVKDNDDYGDDINTRPLSANYLARGSDYLPGDSGLCVPIELNIALHSDAGYRKDNGLIGSLGIYTSDFFDGVTGSGISRLTSRDLAECVISQVTSDLALQYGTWNRRQLYDKNYGESREPQFPSMIFEMLSHQNWDDMKLGHDPNFKFSLARSIYKGIGKFLHIVHQREDAFVAQPLPVCDLSAVVDENSGRIFLNWQPMQDPTDEMANATSYIVYCSVDGKGYDNGTLTDTPSYQIEAKEGCLYRFRVAALNAGGRSMKSDEVCACYAGTSAQRILIADNFQRVAGPLPINNDTQCGFDLYNDPGVIDKHSPGFCGYQRYFEKKGYGKEGVNGLGYSGEEFVGMILAGNTHNYSTLHARSILSSRMFNISSCVGNAMSYIKAEHFQLIDLIFGAQKFADTDVRKYKTFTPTLQQKLSEYLAQGGNVLVSGAFIGSDMQAEDEKSFTEQTLKYRFAGTNLADSIQTTVTGTNIHYALYDSPNEQNYWCRSFDVLEPMEGAFSSMLYDRGGQSASVVYKTPQQGIMVYGFPLECITDDEIRRQIISTSIEFLLNK